MSLPRLMRSRRAAQSTILALTVTLLTGYSVAEGAVDTDVSGHAAPAPTAAQPIGGILDDIARNSGKVLKSPYTPQPSRNIAQDLFNRGLQPRTVRLPNELPRTAPTVIITPAEAADARAWLKTHAQDILHEIGCDQAWSAMTPDETDAEQNLVGSGQLERDYSQRLWRDTADAIEEASSKEFFGRFGSRISNAVNWGKYADDVHGKATELFGPNGTSRTKLERQIEIDGQMYTMALIYYARACLKPPR